MVAGRRAFYAVLGALMAIEYISYNYVVILYDALVISVATYGCELWSIVTRNLTATSEHDIFIKI